MPTEYKANATGLAQALADCGPTAAFTNDDFSTLCKELYKASPPPSESSKWVREAWMNPPQPWRRYVFVDDITTSVPSASAAPEASPSPASSPERSSP